jgi:hypothetical protein
MCTLSSLPTVPSFGTPRSRYPPSGKESLMTTLRFLMTAHFPAVACCSLERLSSTTCDLVRSSSRKILLGSENNFHLALRARSRSTTDLNQIKRVESDPIQALSKVTSWRSRLSLRNEVPTTMGSANGRGRGSPLTLRFSSRARLVHSSMSLSCTTSPLLLLEGGGGLYPYL